MAKQINPFRFKQFIVHHDRCAMKVGTDAVLLGAWVNIGKTQTVLDIGSGSGVIALMLAQRTPPWVRIDAVEIDRNSFLQSIENIARSPWPDKITTHHTTIQDFRTDQRYDLIVSNPPYFVNSLLPPSSDRRDARHTHTLSHQHLLAAVTRFLKPSGKFGLILPIVEGDQFELEATHCGMCCSRRVAFHSRLEKPAERWLLEFSFSSVPCLAETLILYDHDEEWTAAYKHLTSEFYL